VQGLGEEAVEFVRELGRRAGSRRGFFKWVLGEVTTVARFTSESARAVPGSIPGSR
jgi:hypothetical protein